MPYQSGRHFLQIPGPTNVPERVLRAMDRAVIDHRGPAFAALTHEVMDGLREVFATSSPVIMFPSSGSGAWEAALVNTLSPGDRVLSFDQGFFANGWAAIAARLGLDVETVAQDWRRAVDADALQQRLAADDAHEIKAVLVVHNETSTGVVTDIAAVRAALDGAGHPALLLVDTVSSLGSMQYRHADWGVDVTVTGSQKGLMLPPGMGFNAVSDKALAAAAGAGLSRSYWDWQPMLDLNEIGFFPYTPPTPLLFGLREALEMLREEGLDRVFSRHARHAAATRAAVAAWGLGVYALEAAEAGNSVTAVMVPDGVDADELRRVVLERYDMSLGTGLGQVKGKLFRIGHLGDFNDLTLAGTLCGVEMGMKAAGVPFTPGGVAAAMEVLSA